MTSWYLVSKWESNPRLLFLYEMEDCQYQNCLLGQTVLIGRSPVRHWPTFHQKVEDLRSLLWVLPPGQGLLRRPQRGWWEIFFLIQRWGFREPSMKIHGPGGSPRTGPTPSLVVGSSPSLQHHLWTFGFLLMVHGSGLYFGGWPLTCCGRAFTFRELLARLQTPVLSGCLHQWWPKEHLTLMKNSSGL